MSTTFDDLGVSGSIASKLADAAITSPTPIQSGTIPPALDGADICGRAPTGSGKTLAFAIPLVALARRAKPGAPTALVLTPTRELAGQVEDAIRSISDSKTARVASFYGGTSLSKDRRRLQRGVDIAVATPGRLADLVRQGQFDLGSVRLVVLDEADRMADMGFLPEVTRILDQTSSDRQTLLFSATLDGDVDVLIRRYQNDPVTFEVDAPIEQAGDVSHHFWRIGGHERRDMTAQLVRHSSPAIVFTRTKRGADRLARTLGKDGVNAAAIHGDRSQRQREKALEDFARGKVGVLVATDVAARGIHVDDVALVLHYDIAGSDKDYVHRSGRTGRAGATGTVVSFVLPDKIRDTRDIQRALDLPTDLPEASIDLLGERPAPRPRRERPELRRDRDEGRPERSSHRKADRPERNGHDTARPESRAKRERARPDRTGHETARPDRTGHEADRPEARTKRDRARPDRNGKRAERNGSGSGTVKWFHANRGFGFIVPDGGGTDLFVHYTGIAGGGFKKLDEGQRVRYDVVAGRNGPQAAEVRPAA